MSVTGQTIVTNALTNLGINSQGGTPSAGDSNDALARLNSWWESLSVDEGLIWSTTTITQAVTANLGSYTVSNLRRIYKAIFVVGANRNELKIVTTDEYLSHNDLAASASAPDECYCNFAAPGATTVRLWPVPNATGPSLQLEAACAFTVFTLGGSFDLMPGYQELLEWGLAMKVAPSYGMSIAPETLQLVNANGQAAEARIRLETSKNRLIPPSAPGFPQSVMTPEAQIAPQPSQK